MARLRELRGTDPVTAAPPGGTPTPDGSDGATSPTVLGAAIALADLAEPTGPSEPRRFWLSPVPLPVRPAAVKVPADLLLRQLPTPSATLGGPVLIERLRPAYEAFADKEDAP